MANVCDHPMINGAKKAPIFQAAPSYVRPQIMSSNISENDFIAFGNVHDISIL
jgi:hypothetical protein